MHDDQHGTAIVVLGTYKCGKGCKRFKKLKVVIGGAGRRHSDRSFCYALLKTSFYWIVRLIYAGRAGLNIHKASSPSSPTLVSKGDLNDAMRGQMFFSASPAKGLLRLSMFQAWQREYCLRDG